MLKTRIIPVILFRGGEAFKGKGFNSWRSTGSVVSAVKVHARRGVDELILLDIGATPGGKEPDFDLLRTITADCFMPLTFGGGIRTVEHFRLALANGADKVSICTAAFDEGVDLIGQAAKRFGKQAVTVSLDAVDGKHVACMAGQRVHLRRDPVAFAREIEDRGAGEILLNSVERDGTMVGYDLDLIQGVAAAVRIPVVACGGAGRLDDFTLALRAGAHAVAAGAIFDFTATTPAEVALHLRDQDFPVRLDSVPAAQQRAHRSVQSRA